MCGLCTYVLHHRTGSTTHFHDGGNNVTFLTGIFQTILPEITHTIKDVAHKAAQHAEWGGDVTHMGIRSVQYLSFYKAGLKAHREETKRRIQVTELDCIQRRILSVFHCMHVFCSVLFNMRQLLYPWLVKYDTPHTLNYAPLSLVQEKEDQGAFIIFPDQVRTLRIATAIVFVFYGFLCCTALCERYPIVAVRICM